MQLKTIRLSSPLLFKKAYVVGKHDLKAIKAIYTVVTHIGTTTEACYLSHGFSTKAEQNVRITRAIGVKRLTVREVRDKYEISCLQVHVPELRKKLARMLAEDIRTGLSIF